MRLLSRLDLEEVPNLVNIEERFRNPSYDPRNQYSVPYMWGTTAMAVNRAYIKEEADSWAVLWNPAYAGKISMLPSGPEVVGAALKLLGYSLNTSDAQQLEQAKAKLLLQRPLLAGYVDTIDVRDKLIANELWAAQVYVGEAMVAAKSNPDVRYVIPKEGATLWVDNLAIPRDAKHKKNAHLFINYILEAETSAAISNHLWYANPNAQARALALPDIQSSASLYPSDEALSKCEVLLPAQAGIEGQRRQEMLNAIWSALNRESP
jgi:spermidine/putrescine transport system substrate-binding protein